MAVIELLLGSGVAANAASPSGGQTALHIAAGGSDAEVVGALLAGGADISLRTQARGAWAARAKRIARGHGAHGMVLGGAE